MHSNNTTVNLINKLSSSQSVTIYTIKSYDFYQLQLPSVISILGETKTRGNPGTLVKWDTEWLKVRHSEIRKEMFLNWLHVTVGHNFRSNQFTFLKSKTRFGSNIGGGHKKWFFASKRRRDATGDKIFHLFEFPKHLNEHLSENHHCAMMVKILLFEQWPLLMWQKVAITSNCPLRQNT